jgi:hypothetical protein
MVRFSLGKELLYKDTTHDKLGEPNALQVALCLHKQTKSTPKQSKLCGYFIYMDKLNLII